MLRMHTRMMVCMHTDMAVCTLRYETVHAVLSSIIFGCLAFPLSLWREERRSRRGDKLGRTANRLTNSLTVSVDEQVHRLAGYGNAVPLPSATNPALAPVR